VGVLRNFSRWFFDLLRNFVLGNISREVRQAVLFWLHEFALVVIFFYRLSYADQWYLNLFGFLENKRLAHWLNRTVNFSIAAGLVLPDQMGRIDHRRLDFSRANLAASLVSRLRRKT